VQNINFFFSDRISQVGTDVYEGDAIAAESARIAWEKKVKLVVLPTIPF